MLIACPIGPLVAMYRKRIPPKNEIVVETIHSPFKITRAADEIYIPPGRLRNYDLIIFLEMSQQGDHVWSQVRDSLAELMPGPFVVFVCDFQQLQPISREPLLHDALQRQVEKNSLKKSFCSSTQQHGAQTNTG